MNLSLSDLKNIRNCLNTAIQREAFNEQELKQISKLELIEKLDSIIQNLNNIIETKK